VGFQGKFFFLIKTILRMIKKYRYAVPDRSEFVEPAVYVCRHKDNDGPIISMVNLPLPLHPWAYHVWCNEAECYKQCMDYTFTVRYGWSEKKARFVAKLISKPFTLLIRSAGSIPVYRNSMKVRETFRDSVDAMKRGESLLIFPDIDYRAQDGDASKLYEGFLMLEQLYYKATGEHVRFIPIHLNEAKRKMTIDEPILFRDGVPFKEDKGRVIQALLDAMNDAGDRSDA